MKIRTSQLRFLGLLALVIVIIFLTRGLFNRDQKLRENNIKICFEYKQESFAGKVIDTYKSKNRGTFVFIVSNEEGEQERHNLCLVHPEAYIEKGDSIYKLPNSFEYHVYKGGGPIAKRGVEM